MQGQGYEAERGMSGLSMDITPQGALETAGKFMACTEVRKCVTLVLEETGRVFVSTSGFNTNYELTEFLIFAVADLIENGTSN